MKGTPVQLYNPRGVIHIEKRELAPRVCSLAGLRVAILDNTKWNGRKVLESAIDVLAREHGFASVRTYKKVHFSMNAEPELIEQIARESDVALAGIGD